jgi:hypothetical protein
MAAAAAAPGGGRARALSAQELQSKVLDYESFVEDVLKKKLAAIGRRRAALEAEREELAELRRGVLALQAVRGRLGTRAGRVGGTAPAPARRGARARPSARAGPARPPAPRGGTSPAPFEQQLGVGENVPQLWAG